MRELIYIVVGIERHFSGDSKITIVGASKSERDAKTLGVSWRETRDEALKCEGINAHASYKIERRFLG